MKRSIVVRGIVVVLLAGIVLPPPSMPAAPLAVEATPSSIHTPTSGLFRAVIVFVRFRDDTTVWNGCTPASQAWAQPDVLPDFASTLLASSPTPPFPEASLTAYFFQQSQRRFTLYGSVYPHVVVTDGNETEYRQGQTPKLKLEIVTKEILHRLDADPTFDLGAYDANDDGFIDHVFFVLRKMNTLTLVGGASGAAFVGYSSPAPEFGNDPQSLKRIHAGFSGSYIRYHNAGNIFPEVNLLRLMAHEFGHDLWINTPLRGLHVKAIGGDYGAPANGTDRVGYILMAGGGGGRDRRGDETISAYERDALGDGWISCSMLTTEDRYSVTDLYSDNTANCYKLSLPLTSFQPRTLYLSNRQRIGFFDQLRTNTCTDPPNDQGLKTTGLLVTIVQRDQLAVVAADNTLELSNESQAYAGDMYGPETAVQVTPWTVPNINGYTAYPEGMELEAGNFQAIDQIDYTGGEKGEMAFDYVRDFRERPVIREDSWIGAETAGYEFANDVVVTNGSVLTLKTRLSFSGTFRIEEGSEVVIEGAGDVWMKKSSTLELADSTRLIVRGTLTVAGAIRIGRGAEIVDAFPSPTGHTPAEVGHAFNVEAPYPNPFNAQTTLRYTLPKAAVVTVRVYDALGRTVATLVDERHQAGPHRVVFDGANVPSGVYYYRLDAAGHTQIRSMLLLK